MFIDSQFYYNSFLRFWIEIVFFSLGFFFTIKHVTFDFFKFKYFWVRKKSLIYLKLVQKKFEWKIEEFGAERGEELKQHKFKFKLRHRPAYKMEVGWVSTSESSWLNYSTSSKVPCSFLSFGDNNFLSIKFLKTTLYVKSG